MAATSPCLSSARAATPSVPDTYRLLIQNPSLLNLHRPRLADLPRFLEKMSSAQSESIIVSPPPSPLPQAFLLVAQQRRQQIFDHPPLPGLDFNRDRHARRQLDHASLDLDPGRVQRDLGRVDELLALRLAGVGERGLRFRGVGLILRFFPDDRIMRDGQDLAV